MYSQKGISIVLTMIILAFILAIVFGLSAISVSQIRTIKEMGNSVIAFYAADTGAEKVLRETLKYVKDNTNPPPNDHYSITVLDNEATHEVYVVCCSSSHSECYYDGITYSCPLVNTDGKPDIMDDCLASYFCIRSIGTYFNTKRRIEAEVFPF